MSQQKTTGIFVLLILMSCCYGSQTNPPLQLTYNGVLLLNALQNEMNACCVPSTPQTLGVGAFYELYIATNCASVLNTKIEKAIYPNLKQKLITCVNNYKNKPNYQKFVDLALTRMFNVIEYEYKNYGMIQAKKIKNNKTKQHFRARRKLVV